MRFASSWIGLCLSAATLACGTVQERIPDSMAPFARMVPGEWRMTLASGVTSFTAWHWGPGKHSIRGGELELYYWHPGRKEVCILSLHPNIPGIGRGSGEGTMRFEGDTAVGFVDLQQPRHLRQLGTRLEFDGPDKYHETLLEKTGPEGYQPMNGWDFVRVPARPESLAPTAAGARKPAEHLAMFEPLVGGTWESQRTRSTLEAVPDYVYARVLAPDGDGEPTHLLDGYVYQDVRTGALRCLALSDRGGVYEGDLTVLDGGGLQVELRGYEGEQVVPYVVRLDLEQGGSVRSRAWSLEGAERTLRHDARHQRR